VIEIYINKEKTMKRTIERVEPKTVADRPTLASGARRRLTFELTPYAHDLLKEEGKRRRLTQVSLLELIIRDYCNPKREKNVHRSF